MVLHHCLNNNLNLGQSINTNFNWLLLNHFNEPVDND